MERSEDTTFDTPAPSEPECDCLLKSLVQLVETAKQDLERDRQAAKALLAKASSILQSEMDRRSGANDSGTGGLAGWQIVRVRAVIDKNLHSTIHTSDLSAVARRSAAHFARSFKHTFGEFAARLRDEETVGKSSSPDDHQFGVLEPDRTERWIFGPITYVQTLQTSDWSKSIQMAARTRNRWHPLGTGDREFGSPNFRSAADSCIERLR